MRLLTPMIVEQIFAVKTDEIAQQLAKRLIRRSLDPENRAARVLGKFVHAQRHLRGHAESAPSTSFERPEQVRIRTRVRDPNFSVGGYNFRFEQSGGRCPIML